VPNNYYARAAKLGYVAPSANALGSYEAAVIGSSGSSQGNSDYGAAAIINYQFSGYTLSSTLAFSGSDTHPNSLMNGTIAPMISYNMGSADREKAVTEDLKISTPKNEKIEASAGVFYFYEKVPDWIIRDYSSATGAYYGTNSNAALNNAALNYLVENAYDNPKTQEVAPYIQSVWHATPDLDITGSVRYSHYDKKSVYWNYQSSVQNLTGFTPAQQAQGQAMITSLIGPNTRINESTHDGFLSALASATYKFTPDVLGYVTYSRGGRDGGPNPANLPSAVPKTVFPETLDDYEAGVKSQFLDHRLLANLGVFVMVDHNYITTVTSPVGTTTATYLANAQSAISRGIEADIRYQPIDGLTTYASFTYDDTFYGSFTNSACPYELNYQSSCNLTGQALALTPKLTIAVGGEYSRNLGQVFDFNQKPLVG
jgi:iron complex outermembrane receptor protein